MTDIEKIYNKLASTYEKNEELLSIYCKHLIEILNPHPRERLLDVGTGSGFYSI